MPELVNNLNLTTVRETQKKVETEGGHFPLEKHIEGEFHFDGSPMFTAILSSNMATFAMGVDEPSVLGGRGVYASPLNYLMLGVLSCYASTIALSASLKGVKLNKLKLKGHLFYDVGPMLQPSDFPLAKELKIEVECDKDISDIIKNSSRCPAFYIVSHGVKTEVKQV
ncbi:MAG: OsmC family protein [Thermoplasmatales archaeon]